MVEFLLKNASFQFVLVFIDKFIHLVKPYTKYSYSEEGIDRGYAIRECSKRIVEMSKDRQKLKAERNESAALKKRMQQLGSVKRGRQLKQRYVIDEDAFYSQKEGEEETATKKTSGQKNGGSKKPMESNLAKKLGLDEDDPEEKAHREKRKGAKMSKEEMEREKEKNEVREIIEKDSLFNKYIKEVNLLGSDANSNEKAQPTKSREC